MGKLINGYADAELREIPSLSYLALRMLPLIVVILGVFIGVSGISRAWGPPGGKKTME
jgi:hypothetical protein